MINSQLFTQIYSLWNMIRSPNAPKNNKTQLLREEIRRRDNDHKFRIMRIDYPDLNKHQAKQLCIKKIQQLKMLIECIRTQDLTKLQFLLKQLRDLSCSGLAPQIFTNVYNLKVLVDFQNKAIQHPQIDHYTLEFVHTIFLNITGNEEYPNKLAIQQLSFQYFCDVRINVNVIQTLLKICSNCLLTDKTSSTLFYLISISKIDIYHRIYDMILCRPQLYQSLESSVLQVTRILLTNTYNYQFQKNCSESFLKYIDLLYQRISKKIIRLSKEKELGIGATKNQLLRTLKIILRSDKVDFDQQLIQALESPTIFNPGNTYFIELMTSLAFRTCYTLKKSLYQNLLEYLFMNLQNDPVLIIRLISNSLLNNSKQWEIIYQYFGEKYCSYNGEVMDRQKLPNTASYIYFLEDARVSYDICQIIGIIVYHQGGLGIFEQCLEQMANNHFGREKLKGFGFEL